MKMHEMLLSHLSLGHSLSSMKRESYEVALKGKRKIAESTYEFIFEKPKGFNFYAGQHVRMTLLNILKTDDSSDSRFLTLANTPQDKDLIFAMRMTDSAFKKKLEKMQCGEKVIIQILLNSPHGSFVIHADSSKPAVFLVGGIGIVPAYSIIKDAIEKKLKHNIFLFYSNRRPEDAPYLNELQTLAKQNHNFTLVATMTDPDRLSKTWQGETGYINQVMLRKYLADLESPVYYIAGLTGMVNSMKNLLKELKIDEENIRSEDFSNMKMGIMNMHKHTNFNKNHALIIPVVLIVTTAIIAHAGIVSQLQPFSFSNLSYLTIGLIVIIVLFKLLIIFKFKHFAGLQQKK
jgi:ferredoxin-NADP reductase